MTLTRSVLLATRPLSNWNIKRYYSIKDLRNIGILAHIDAGKTTTTERMLFYAGKTRSLGEVHRGNTVTDYLKQERERGITICSSAVTFPWRDKKINLLDTPGHIDFTMEVEQSLNAVDGVIVVLDGTAGVEAQTITVWEQAERYKLPKVVFVNKMDRPDANYEKCIEDLIEKLDAIPICIQCPQWDAKGNLNLCDVINLQKLSWHQESLGREYQTAPLEGAVLAEVEKRRQRVIDHLSGIDDELAENIISSDGFEQVTNELITRTLRRATTQCKVVPVLLGSAYKNIGIQKLMDAIVDYLPAPDERNQLYDCFGDDFVGKVFKIVHDKQRGPLTLLRVFRGEMKKGMRVVTGHSATEVVSRIYEPLADEYREINAVAAGDVALCSGMKATVTGDLLTMSTSSLRNAQKKLSKLLEKGAADNNAHNDDDDDDVDHDTYISEIFSTEPKVPDAVYFCSIEPPSLSSQNAMEFALRQLQREDPSLRVSYDAVTGQTVLGGMGELHMEIIKSRILTEYKIEVDLGPLQIAYKETIETSEKATLKLEKEIAGTKQSVDITLELVKNQKEAFSLDKSPENIHNLNAIRPRMLQVIRKGALAALERGPRVGGQMVDTQVRLHSITVGRGTADSFVMAAAAQCIQKILNSTRTRLLEPVMALQIAAPTERISTILADLSRRRAVIKDVLPKGERNKLIVVNAPLAELSGYSSVLRTISSGTASMTMQPCGFANMNANDEETAVRRAQGLE